MKKVRPEFESWQGGVRATFLENPYTPRRLHAIGPNNRQIRAVIHAKEHESTSNREYQELTCVKERTATAELSHLVEEGIFERIGTTG